MESSSSSSLLVTSSSGNKRAREADLAAGGGEGPESQGKRLRPEDLLDMLDDETEADAGGDLASVMRSLEEEISAGELELETGPPQPELGFLLEASDDELGLPPAGGSYTSSDDYAAEPADGGLFGAQIWGFEDEIDGGAADYGFGAVTSSPEAAAAAAAAAAEWGDDGFGDGLFGFGDESFGASDLAALRQETMPAV
ncbi:uncharacterized protein LOC124667485 [Lolium rigidum]|uniref:uncharacterized protein LOC124667485 n=1 Tax=Lolium rigidum TaxID=89674 RepID=UPI001F5C3FE2|nr:uncharacterized protein LOC124667485 [Lolium rigidum]